MGTVKRIFCVILITLVIVAEPLLVNAADKPRIMVESCTVDGGVLVADSECEVTITLRNMSTTLGVSSIIVTAYWQNDLLPAVDFTQTNQAYVSSISPTQTRNIVFSLKTKSVNIETVDTIPLYLDIVYSYDQSPDNSNTVIVQLPVNNGQVIVVDPPAETFFPEDDGSMFDFLLLDNMRLFYIGGSALCALMAAVLIIRRIRQK